MSRLIDQPSDWPVGALYGTPSCTEGRARRLPEARQGTMTAYALILVSLAGLFIARFSVTSLNTALVNRLHLADQQACQGAEAGLEICLRLATNSFYIVGQVPASFTVHLNPVQPFTSHLATMTVYDEVATNTFGNLHGSATAFVYDRSRALAARRTVTNEIEVTAPGAGNNKRFKRRWERH